MKKSQLKQKPPAHLSRRARDWWKRIAGEWNLDDAGLLILQSAMEAFDRMVEAQALIKKDGAVVEDRFGQLKVHPGALVERDSRSAMLAALKALHLDLEPLQDGPGRPPAGF